MSRLSRRAFVASAAALACPAVAKAARRAHVFMVLGRGENDNETGFREELARRGIEASYTIRNTDGDPAALPAIIAEIRATRPDLVYSWGTPQTRALVGPHDAADPGAYIRDIPVVFTFVAAPLDAGIVSSLERPGGNVTGTIHIAPVNAQIATMLAWRPLRRLGVVFNPAERNSVLAVEALRPACAARGIALIKEPLPLDAAGRPAGETVPERVGSLAVRGAEMLYVGPDTFLGFTRRRDLAHAALAHRLPTFSVTEFIVRTEGALMSLAPSSLAIGKLTGAKAAQILNGEARPGDIPVETLKRFSVVINMKTARSLNLYPPMRLLDFAEILNP